MMRLAALRTFDYTKQNAPTELVEHFKRRVWSAIWNLKDEELDRGARLMQAHVNANYKDTNQPITITHTFYATVFLSPDF